MPFNSLVLKCLTTKTSHTDAGTEVRMTPQAGERILLFVIDDSSNPGCTFRIDMGLRPTDIICDCIFFYLQDGRPKKVLCLTELKGSDLKHAVEQILSTYRLLSEKCGRKNAQQIEWKACIRVRTSSPVQMPSNMKELINLLGNNNVKILRAADVGAFVRG